MKRTAALLGLALVLVFGAPSLAGGEEETKQADAALQKLIDAAIDRGADWLAKQQAANGSFPSMFGASYPMGTTALSLLALLHSGVARDDPVVTKALEFVRRAWARRSPGSSGPAIVGHRVYSVSVAVMALAAYGRSGRGDFSLERPDFDCLKEMVAWLVARQGQSGVWRYPEGGYDHSNSQYALLALKEARRCGIPVAEGVFAKALLHFLGAQERSGPKVRRHREKGGDGIYAADRETIAGYDRARGWGYLKDHPATGAMTAAGVASVAICAKELTGNRWGSILASAEQATYDGLAWLGREFSVEENPKSGPGWHYYYLYGLERAGVLAGVVYMGSHRWYAEGAKYLVDAQNPDGAWRTLMSRQTRDTVDPAFALLFLSRATARAIGVATEAPLLDLTSAESLSDDEFGKLFLAARVEMSRLDPEAEKDRARDFALMGPRVIPLLLRDLTAPDEARRARAILILESITGKTFGYEATASATLREEAFDRWASCILGNRSTLALDRETGLIR